MINNMPSWYEQRRVDTALAQLAVKVATSPVYQEASGDYMCGARECESAWEEPFPEYDYTWEEPYLDDRAAKRGYEEDNIALYDLYDRIMLRY